MLGEALMFNSSVLKKISIYAAMIFAMGSAASHATVVQIDSASSVIHTAGGIDGGGFGDLTLSGTFDVAVVGSNLVFSNYNVLVQPALGFPIATLLFGVAVYDGLHFNNARVCVALVGVRCPSANISGTYDGKNFSLNGFYFSNFPDDYSYTTVLNASAVPVPASIWLFGSALVGVCGFSRRKVGILK
jgi:hypothetical protein